MSILTSRTCRAPAPEFFSFFLGCPGFSSSRSPILPLIVPTDWTPPYLDSLSRPLRVSFAPRTRSATTVGVQLRDSCDLPSRSRPEQATNSSRSITHEAQTFNAKKKKTLPRKTRLIAHAVCLATSICDENQNNHLFHSGVPNNSEPTGKFRLKKWPKESSVVNLPTACSCLPASHDGYLGSISLATVFLATS